MLYNIIFLLFLVLLSPSIWCVGGKSIQAKNDSAFPSYACRLDFKGKVLEDGLEKGNIDFPCSSVLVERTGADLKIITAAHCVVTLDINENGDKVYYHDSILKNISCPSKGLDEKVSYNRYKVTGYTVSYNKQYLKEKAALISLDKNRDLSATKGLSLIELSSNSAKNFSPIEVNDTNYRTLVAKVASLDLAVIKVKVDCDTSPLNVAKITAELKKDGTYNNCRIAGYSKKNNEISVGEISKVIVGSGYLYTTKRGQKSWIEWGDSGGPLYCEKDGVWEVIGLASSYDAILSETTLLWTEASQPVINKLK
jgi:hypothetical protein